MILIRACEGFDELEACVQLQIATWGIAPSEVVARKTFYLGQRIGGQVIGAFDSEIAGTEPESLVGFVMSLPGIKTNEGAPVAYLHSHMLAVREEYRNRGLGAQLKLEQRREALERGIGLIEWTFDPLEIKNAFLNISKLGAVARRYYPNFYGVSSSQLQAGLPTDRLVAEWWLDSPRVAAAINGRPIAKQSIAERITVPASIYQWKATDREGARAIQLENRSKFQAAFARGLAVMGFVRDSDGNGVFELGPLTEPEQASNTKEKI